MEKYLLLVYLFIFQTGICQDAPFNDYKFVSLYQGESIDQIDTVEALIYHFSSEECDRFFQAIDANPQLKEIQLNNPPERAVHYVLNSERLIDLNTVFIFGFYDDSLTITPKMGLKHIWIYSEMIKSFQLTGDSLCTLEQLQLSMPELTTWTVNEELNKLEYLELITPKLSFFPIVQMKNLGWLTVYSSFSQLPTVFCQLEMLQIFTFSNYKEIEVPKCFQKRIKKTLHHDVEIKSSSDGDILQRVFILS